MTTLLASALSLIGTAVPAYVFAPSTGTEFAAIAILGYALFRVTHDVASGLKSR